MFLLVTPDARQPSDKFHTHTLAEKCHSDIIEKKFDYLINNENDLFTFNLDKKFFMINFFSTK